MFKKGKIFALAAFILLLGGAVGLAACGEEHVHEWGAWETVTASTCTEEGTEKRVCPGCGEEEVRPAEKLAHNYGEWYVVNASTCSVAGTERRDCVVCNPDGEDGKAHETRALELLAHTPRTAEKIEANCLEAGREAGTECAVCGAVLDGMQEIPALGHALGEAVKVSDSTCTNHGIERRVCTRTGCSHFEETELELLPHGHEPLGTPKEANCLESGITAGDMCPLCGEVFEQQEEIPAYGHEFTYAPLVRDGAYYHTATCGRDGCGTVEEQECSFEVEKTPATCTTAEFHHHYCKYCTNVRDHEEGEPLGHNYGAWFFDVEAYDASLRDSDGAATVVRRHKRVCTNYGHELGEHDPDVVDCTEELFGDPVEATCTTAGYKTYRCPTCEATYTGERTDAFGHKWEKDAGGVKDKLTTEFYQGMWVHFKTCERCGQNGTYYSCYYTTAKWESATCEKGLTIVRTCNDCGHRVEESRGEPLGHTYTGWSHVEGTSGSGSMHSRQCQRCGDVDEAPCSMKPSDKVATCVDPGQRIDVCEQCKYHAPGDAIPELGHSVDGQPYGKDGRHLSHFRICRRCGQNVYEECAYETSTTEASCTEDAKTTHVCVTCGDTYVTIAEKAKGHQVAVYTDSDLTTHAGKCIYCEEDVTVPHDFSESNICRVCGRDGLAYAFVAGSQNTRATVVRAFLPGTQLPYSIPASRIVIPEEVDIDGRGAVPVVGIGTNAFFRNPYIREVVLPTTVEKIDYNAFDGCVNLAQVSIAGHNVGEAGVVCALNRIENDAFHGCTSLTNAILPATLQYIGARAFEGCTSLSEINIPELVTEIQDHAFRNTAYFNDPDRWHNGVLYIGPHLIQAQTALQGEYIVETGTVSISAEAFKDCTLLTRIVLPAALKAVDMDAFLGCTALETVVFKGTFEEYLGIRFDNDAASPMHFASALTIEGAVGDPHIPDGTTVIPAGAFRGSQIEHIVIPASVTSIGANAFAGCTRLVSVTFEAGSKLLSIGEDVVKGTEFFNTAANWKNGALYLREQGTDRAVALVAADRESLPAYSPYDGESADGDYLQAEIEEGTLAVAPRVFAGFTELRYVSVASTVVYLGAGIFDGCTGLDRVNFRGTGLAWFCYSPSIGRVYTDSYVYGGAAGDGYATQRMAAGMFKLYTLNWKRGNYGAKT